MADHSFKLSKTLVGHEQDVRGVCSLDDGELVCTSSRDRSVRVWNSKTGEQVKILYGHEHFVGAITCLPPSPYFSPHQPCIVSGGNDKIINVWDLETGNPFLTLIGHNESVVSLSHTQGLLISGSWDKTAKVWKGTECIQTLTGHAHSVWAVLGVDSGDILTGSADHTIKLWRGGVCVDTLKKHKDCVRGLANVPTVGFLSCGNDCMIFLWSYSGQCLYEMAGHGSFIYSVALLPSGEFVSSSEDCTLKVWRDGHNVDTIQHSSSVWCCTSLPNGDIVSGCADGKARVWTRDDNRIATPQEIEEYHSQLQQSVATTTGGNVGDINTDKLAGPEALNVPGTKDGESKLIRNGNMVEAYKWSANNNQWLKIGEVIDARSSPAKQLLQGKQYDYVFDVDIGDGNMRKLGYDSTENPYTVAQEFLWKEELDQGFLDTVAQFIIRNAKTVTIGPDKNATTFKDPFTGGNRYVPASDSMDYSSTSKQPQSKHYPQKAGLLSDTANYNAIITKVNEFNTQIAQSQPNVSMNSKELDLLNSAVKILSETSRYHVSTLSQAQLQLIFTKLLHWPTANIFPILDIIRLTVLHPSAAETIAADWNKILPKLLDIGFKSSLPANQLLVLRFIGNMFRWESLHTLLKANEEQILGTLADCAHSDNKNIRIALATVLLNYSSLYLTNKSQEGKVQCLSILAELINNDKDDEVIYRSLVSLGTLLWDDDESKSLARDLDITQSVKKHQSSAVPKVKECATEIEQLLST